MAMGRNAGASFFLRPNIRKLVSCFSFPFVFLTRIPFLSPTVSFVTVSAAFVCTLTTESCAVLECSSTFHNISLLEELLKVNECPDYLSHRSLIMFE